MCGHVPLSHFERRLDQALDHAADRGCRRLLISSENLSNLVYAHALELHRLIASRCERTKVFYYVRRQDDWILSSWQQWHHKAGVALEAWVDHCIERRIPDFLATANSFEDVYGAGSLSVVPLHGSAFGAGGLLPDFYRRAGIEMADGSRGDPISNQAVNPYLCDILARIPSVFESQHHDMEVAARLARHVSSADLLFRRHGEFMNDAVRNRILDHFAPDNRELHRRYFGHLDFDALFGRVPTVAEDSRTATEIEAIKEILAIQMDLLMKLMKSSEAQARPGALKIA
ncbi:hypothetical protein HK102_011541 [Quaeritorhiza haematococci]|nr:hypothetical protein HK102_011541 [Quaeritorhiza haematococci]